MIAALIKLGFSELAAQEFTDNGITALNRPRTLSSDALDMLIKQIHRDNQGQGLFISFNAQQHIRAIRFWTNRRHIIGKDYTLDMLDENLAKEWAEAMKIEAEASKAPNDLIKTLEPFKKDTKWRAWKESVLTNLHSEKGQANVPLAYIVRKYNYPLPGVTYQTVHDELVASTFYMVQSTILTMKLSTISCSRLH
jgi:hypothetical protein